MQASFEIKTVKLFKDGKSIIVNSSEKDFYIKAGYSDKNPKPELKLEPEKKPKLTKAKNGKDKS